MFKVKEQTTAKIHYFYIFILVAQYIVVFLLPGSAVTVIGSEAPLWLKLFWGIGTLFFLCKTIIMLIASVHGWIDSIVEDYRDEEAARAEIKYAMTHKSLFYWLGIWGGALFRRKKGTRDECALSFIRYEVALAFYTGNDDVFWEKLSYIYAAYSDHENIVAADYWEWVGRYHFREKDVKNFCKAYECYSGVLERLPVQKRRSGLKRMEIMAVLLNVIPECSK